MSFMKSPNVMICSASGTYNSYDPNRGSKVHCAEAAKNTEAHGETYCPTFHPVKNVGPDKTGEKFACY